MVIDPERMTEGRMITRSKLIRRLVPTVLTLGAGTLVWRSRIIQVAAFAAAAGVRGQYLGRASKGPASRSTDWIGLSNPHIAPVPLNPSILVTYHPEYHGYDPQRAVACLDAIRRLGAGWMRTDIRWREILPDGVRPDPRALAWYRDFLSAASAYGLKSAVVLSTPPDRVLKQPESQRLESWSRFVEVVAAELVVHCGICQLMNEPNNLVYRFFSRFAAGTAVSRAASIIRLANPKTNIAVNLSMECWGWKAYLAELLKLSGRAVDIVGLDHYPGTWAIGPQARWGEVFKLADTIASATTDSPWFNRHLMIMETGYSTNALMRNQESQAKYFENLIRSIDFTKWRSVGEKPLLGIYELCDGDSSAFLDPEAHFGLLTSDLVLKRAFTVVTADAKALS